jgi:GAF domain-containing protein
MHLYEQTIRSARENGFAHVEGVANEVAARFYMARGFEKIAYTYLREARYCYLRWDAAGKVRQLDALYPQLREQEPVPGPTSTIGASVEQLDLATVIKVSQAVSGQIVLEKLIDALMRIAIVYAGAERGLLILPRGIEQRIEAEATTSGDTITVRLGEALMAEAAAPEVNHPLCRAHTGKRDSRRCLSGKCVLHRYLHSSASRPAPFSACLINQAKLVVCFT